MAEDKEYTDALPQGSRLEGYEVVRVLGMGGFGMTYLGFDDNLDIAVAIKEYLPGDLARRDGSLTVNPRSTDDASDFQWGLDRFLSEARDLARFDHPNIISVRRFFKAHGTAYIVMDYAEGKTLSELLKQEGQMTEARVKEILLPLLDGLEDVHQSGLLHRDIKPGNIIIKDNGQPVLIDFGAARQQTGARSRSMTAIVTPGYAPPEQYSSKSKQGTWTDIYALAAVAYRMLTGIQPEDSPDRMMDDELVPASQTGKGQASPSFLKAIDQALSLNGQDRPQDIAAFRAALGGEAAIQLNRKPTPGQKKQTKAAAPFWQGLPSFGLNKAVITGLVIALITLPALGYGYVQYVQYTTNDDVSWQRAQRANTVEAYENYMVSFPIGSYQAQAIAAIKALEQAKRDEARRAQAEAKRRAEEKARQRAQAEAKRRAEGEQLLKAFLSKYSFASINARDEDGDTPLHKAADVGNEKVAALLIKKGAKVKARNEFENTPLHKAAAVGNEKVAALLIEAGADVNARNRRDNTTLHYAMDVGNEKVAALLIKKGAKVKARNEFGATPLHWAGNNGNEKIAALLIQKGADVNARNKAGNTPLHWAEREGKSSTAAILRRAGGRK